MDSFTKIGNILLSTQSKLIRTINDNLAIIM